MDYHIVEMKSVPNAQTVSEESMTCIAVKEDRHQNIMSSVEMKKKGVEELWTIERVAKCIDLLGHREITLESDTVPAIIAFGNRVAEMCKAEGHHRGRGEGRQRVEWAHRKRGDAAAWTHPNRQVSH